MNTSAQPMTATEVELRRRATIITQAVLAVLKKGGDNLAVYNIVCDALVTADAIMPRKQPSPSLDEETIEAAALRLEELLTPESGAGYGMMSDEQRRYVMQVRSHNSTVRCCVAAIRSLLKSTPNQQVGRGERNVQEEMMDCYQFGRVPAPAVSGEGWMKEAAKDIRNVLNGPTGQYTDADGVAAIIARHFPSPEGTKS